MFWPLSYAVYQTAAVASFQKTIPADFAGIFTKTGRGYPDIPPHEMEAGGKVILEGGTSVSAPTFAAIVALNNDCFVAAQKPVLGSFNPFIYSKAASDWTQLGLCMPRVFCEYLL
jgi:tripeptidyl-peptidase-1